MAERRAEHLEPHARRLPYRRPVTLGVGLAIVLVAAWYSVGRAPTSAAPGLGGLAPGTAPQAVARRETRLPLDPALFVGKARRAHQVARTIPDVLDQLYCYCGCDKLVGHQSLLSCFTDSHAAT